MHVSKKKDSSSAPAMCFTNKCGLEYVTINLRGRRETESGEAKPDNSNLTQWPTNTYTLFDGLNNRDKSLTQWGNWSQSHNHWQLKNGFAASVAIINVIVPTLCWKKFSLSPMQSKFSLSVSIVWSWASVFIAMPKIAFLSSGVAAGKFASGNWRPWKHS